MRVRPFARVLLVLVGISAHFSFPAAETIVKGDISNVIFKSSNNPFVVDSSIIIPDGKNVTIDSGCILLFKEFTDLEVKGGLTIGGDSVSPVIFTSFNDQAFNKKSGQAANPFDWKGIHILHGAGTVILKNFRLMFSVYGIKCESSQLTIENGIFRQNGRSSVEIKGKKSAINDNEPVFMAIAPEEPKSNAIATFIGKGDATLFIETEPAGAEISIENVKIPKVSPVRIDSVVAGQYAIKAQKDQMVGSMNTVLENGEIKRVFIKIERQKTVVRVITEPPDAEVFVNKKISKREKCDLVTPGLLKNVPDQKSLMFSFYKFGFLDTVLKLPLSPQQVNNVYLEMKPAGDRVIQAQKSFERKRKLARMSKYAVGAAIPFFAASGALFYFANKDNKSASKAKDFLENTVERQGPLWDENLRVNSEKASSGNRKQNAGIICGAAGCLLLGAGLVFYF